MSKHTSGPWHVFDNRTDKSFDRYDAGKVGVGSRLNADVAHCYGHDSLRSDEETLANANLIAAAPEMQAVLDDLEDSFDKEIYPEQKKEDFDAPDDREYTVTITAKQWRALGRALGKATGAA